MRTFPDFGKELKRPFEVHENCYDCADFYDGCQGWDASRDFDCRHPNRLPDVLRGTCGQRFPPSRQRPPAEPESIEQQPAESSQQPDSEPDTTTPPQIETPPKNPPSSQPVKPKARICNCGAPLPKGKRLCDACRTQNRRASMREYMRTRRGRLRGFPVGPRRAVYARRNARYARWGRGSVVDRAAGRGPPCSANNCITKHILRTI